MTDEFTKEYSHSSQARDAAHNHQWLTALAAPIPDLHIVDVNELRLRHLHGHHARPTELAAVASLLGGLHGRAHRTRLRNARLDQDFPTSSGLTLPGFTTSRHARLHHHCQHGLISPEQLHHGTSALTHAKGQPAAFYKDTNIRNVLITDAGPTFIDFDDLTLAPFGYDLAKLLFSAAMTYGRLSPATYPTVLAAYEAAVRAEGGPARACSWDNLIQWLELHYLLTVSYLGRNGYQHRWETVRPGTDPDQRA